MIIPQGMPMAQLVKLSFLYSIHLIIDVPQAAEPLNICSQHPTMFRKVQRTEILFDNVLSKLYLYSTQINFGLTLKISFYAP